MKSKRGQQSDEPGGDTVTEEVPTEQVAAPVVGAELPAAPDIPPAPAPIAEEASVIETDLQVIVGPEEGEAQPDLAIATVTQLPVTAAPSKPAKDRMASLLERLERLEQGLSAVGERLDKIAPPDVRLVEAHDDPSRMSPWNERHAAAAALPRDFVSVSYELPLEADPGSDTAAEVDDRPDYLPDEVFTRLQRTVADRLKEAKRTH